MNAHSLKQIGVNPYWRNPRVIGIFRYFATHRDSHRIRCDSRLQELFFVYDESMKYLIVLASVALAAQENIFLYGPGIQTVKIQNLMPGSNGAGVEFQSHDTSVGGSIHRTGTAYGIFDYALFEQGRITIATRTSSGAAVDTLTAKAGNVGVGTNYPEANQDVRATV